MIDHKVDCPEVDAAIAELTRASASAAPLMRRVATVMLDAVEENFAQEGRPAWMFPTPVGMNRTQLGHLRWLFNVPHTRGDEPCGRLFPGSVIVCSPHPWG